MKPRQVFLCIALIIFVTLLFSACQTQEQRLDAPPTDSASLTSDAVFSPAPPIESQAYDPNAITMSVFLFDDTYMKNIARLYEEKTGVRINIQNNYVAPDYFETEIVDSSGTSITVPMALDPYPETSIYEERALTELMAGSGADIYDVSYLDFEYLGKNGLLVDMSDWLKTDPAFGDDVIFRDILLSTKTKDGVFALPTGFGFRKLFTTTPSELILEDKRRTWKEFFDEVSEVEYTQSIAYTGTELDVFMERFVARASEFIDESTNSQTLDSDEMILLLEECRDWRDMGLCTEYGDPSTLAVRPSYAGYFTDLTSILRSPPEEDLRSGYGGYPFAPMIYDGEPVLTDGHARYPEVLPHFTCYGVNAGSPNAQAAQDFLRFLLSAEGQELLVAEDRYGENGYPINRAVFRSVIESKQLWDTPEILKNAEKTMDEMAYMVMPKPYHRTIIREVAKQFFLGKISAEEAAMQMANKVDLYLKELG